MKTISFITIAIAISIIATSCQNDADKKDRVITDSSSIRSFEIYKGDTFNRIDLRGNKQGKWYIFDHGHKIADTLFYKNDVELDKK